MVSLADSAWFMHEILIKCLGLSITLHLVLELMKLLVIGPRQESTGKLGIMYSEEAKDCAQKKALSIRNRL